MATSATVTALSGQAWVRQPDGSLTALRTGSIVAPDSEIVTAAGASVTLAIDGAAPITLGENRSVALTDDLFAAADPAEASVRTAGGGRFCQPGRFNRFGAAFGRAGIGR